MAILSDDGCKAWRGWFATAGNTQLSDANVELLVAFFKSQGTTLVDMHHTLKEGDDVGDFEERWLDVAEDAGISTKSGRKDIVRWTRTHGGAAAARKEMCIMARAFHAELDAWGVADAVLRSAQLVGLVNSMSSDTEHEQSTGYNCVWVLYTGEWPTDPKLISELSGMLSASKGASKRGNSGFNVINIKGVERYYKVHKTGACKTLQNALDDPSGIKWLAHTVSTTQMLSNNNLLGAAARFMRFVALGQQAFPFNIKAQLRYTRNYFFDECTGLGLPTDFGEKSFRETQRMCQSPLADAALEANYQANIRPVGKFSEQAPPAMGELFSDDHVNALVDAKLRALGVHTITPATAITEQPRFEEIKCVVCDGAHSVGSCTIVQKAKADMKREKVAADSAARVKRLARDAEVRAAKAAADSAVAAAAAGGG